MGLMDGLESIGEGIADVGGGIVKGAEDIGGGIIKGAEDIGGGIVKGVEGIGGGLVEVAEGVVMAPAEIAHWALGKMFGDPDAALQQIAGELADMGQQVEQLSKDVSSALGQLSWHGPAADAFINHAGGRVRELNGVADQLQDLSGAVKRLASIY